VKFRGDDMIFYKLKS